MQHYQHKKTKIDFIHELNNNQNVFHKQHANMVYNFRPCNVSNLPQF